MEVNFIAVVFRKSDLVRLLKISYPTLERWLVDILEIPEDQIPGRNESFAPDIAEALIEMRRAKKAGIKLKTYRYEIYEKGLTVKEYLENKVLEEIDLDPIPLMKTTRIKRKEESNEN